MTRQLPTWITDPVDALMGPGFVVALLVLFIAWIRWTLNRTRRDTARDAARCRYIADATPTEARDTGTLDRLDGVK